MTIRHTGVPDRFVRSEPFEIFSRPQRSTPARLAGLVVRRRAEMTVAVLAVLVWGWLVDRMPRPAAGALVVGIVVLVVAVGPSRRYVVRRGWAVLTRHRLRSVCVQRRVMNYAGNLPVQLWARPTAVGERIWLLLRAGIEVGDLERNLDYIASACWARTARVEAHRRMVALVVVDVVRRDPLAATVPAPPSLTTQTGRPSHPLTATAGPAGVPPAIGGAR